MDLIIGSFNFNYSEGNNLIVFYYFTTALPKYMQILLSYFLIVELKYNKVKLEIELCDFKFATRIIHYAKVPRYL